MSQRNRIGLAPLAVIAGSAALTACVCSLTVAGVVLRANHRTTAPIWQVVLAGGPMALVLAGQPRHGLLLASRGHCDSCAPNRTSVA